MVRAYLKGPAQCQWNIGGRFIHGAQWVDLTEQEIKKHSDVIETSDQPVVPLEEKVDIKYTESELFAMNKDEQTEILKGLGLKVPRLEKDRVKAIMEAYHDKQ